MVKLSISISGLFLILSLLQCTGVQKPDPSVIACKKGCETTHDRCVRKALKNEAKKAACEAVRFKCSGDCEKK